MVVISIVLALFIIFAYWFNGQIAIDKCLDSGGRWDYDKSLCEYLEMHGK